NALAISSRASVWVISTVFTFKASRSARAMSFASRKSRMRAPLHRRTEKIGACIADPFANGEGAEEIDTFTIPNGCRRRVYRPCSKLEARPVVLSIITMLCCIFRLAKAAPGHFSGNALGRQARTALFPFWPKPSMTRRISAADPRHLEFDSAVNGLMTSRPAETASTNGMSGARKVYIKSFGCQMNVYDSHRMADTLAPEGFAETATPEDADLVILNTCHIREKAAEKVYSELGRVRLIKQAAARDGRRVTIAVAGCVAQAEGEEIIRRAPSVDLVVGPQSYHRLPTLLARAERGERAVDTEFPIEDKFDALPAPSRDATRRRGVSAFVTVQEGCDKFCTFCVVPYTRGAETSRPVAKIVAEAERLADAGVREITLIGQNVNAYHGEGPDRRAWSLGR